MRFLNAAEIWAEYLKLKSVHKVGKLIGQTGDSVWKLLKSSGYKLDREKWTSQQMQQLRNYYEHTSHDFFSVKEIADILKRSEDAITLKAGELGICDSKRKAALTARTKMSESQRRATADPDRRRRISEAVKESIKRNGHPRGMLGKKHSKETKTLISENSRRLWEDPNSKFNQPEFRQRLSDISTKSTRRGNYSRCNGGKREDLGGKYFRSAWEANVARYLNYLQKIGEITKWEYEADTFWFEQIKRGNRSYTPDFKVWDKNLIYYIELKGWMDNRSKTKLQRMAKYYPNIKIDLIGEDRYRTLKKQFKPLIPAWE